MNRGVKEFNLLCLVAIASQFLVTLSLSAKAETIKLESSLVSSQIINNFDLSSSELTFSSPIEFQEQSKTITYLNPETDYALEKIDFSQEYSFQEFFLLPNNWHSNNISLVSAKHFTLKNNEFGTDSLGTLINTSQEKKDKKSSILIADEPLPPSQQGIYWSPSRPDSHAPISVMGEHIHSEGEIMLSYRYMLMEMDGSLVGVDEISDEKILEQFPITPTRMTMQMHMFGMMYGITDNLTLMAMLPYVVKDMDHLTRSNRRFNTDSEGIGDITVTGLYQIFNQDQQRIHLNAGISIPTGSIEARDATPAGQDQLLPYPMQLGSGTLDLKPGFTYLGQSGDWSWGSQVIGTLRLGENSNSYKFGDEIMLTAWGARKFSDWVSTSLRIKGRNWGNIGGQDTRLNPNLVPTADPQRRGGTQIDIGFGINLFVPEGDLRSGRLAIEFEVPIYRALSGPQLETDWQLTAGLQFSF